jgi:hypothetical protein
MVGHAFRMIIIQKAEGKIIAEKKIEDQMACRRKDKSDLILKRCLNLIIGKGVIAHHLKSGVDPYIKRGTRCQGGLHFIAL